MTIMMIRLTEQKCTINVFNLGFAFFGSQHLQTFNLFDMRSKRWWWTQYTIHVQYDNNIAILEFLVFCHHLLINFLQDQQLS